MLKSRQADALVHAHLANRQAPTPGAYSSGSNPDRDNLPSDEAWFGTPDPDIYAAGTNALDKQQLEEERRKGNVLTLRDVRLAAEKAQGWELEVGVWWWLG